MRLVDVATEYCSIAIFREDTADTIIRVARLFEERSGVQSIQDINLTAITRWRGVTLRNCQPVSFNGYLRYLRLLGDYMVEEGHWDSNLFKKLKTAPVPDIPPKSLDPAVLHTAIAHLKKTNHPKPAWFWIIVIRCLYYTGIRRRQIVTIERQDIDLNKKILICSYRGSKTRRQWEIPIADPLIQDLTYLVQRNEDFLGRVMKPNDRLFNVCRFYPRYLPDPHHPGAMRPEQVTGFFRRLSNELDLRLGAHRIRHTTATELCNPEEDIEIDLFSVQKIMGHTMLTTTRRYVHSKLTRMRKIVNTGLMLPD